MAIGSLTCGLLYREIPHHRRPAHQHGYDWLLPHAGQTARLATSLDVEIRSCCEEEGSVPRTEKRREMIDGRIAF
jgi:hypothetical protein